MKFQDAMKQTLSLSTDPSQLCERTEPNYHDYGLASNYLSVLEGDIRSRLSGPSPAPDMIRGTASLAAPGLAAAAATDCLLVGSTCKVPVFRGFSRQYLGVYLTEKGCVLLKDLAELAEKDGIALSFALDYQGHQVPLAPEALSLKQQYLLPHTHSLTPKRPSLRVSYSFQVA